MAEISDSEKALSGHYKACGRCATAWSHFEIRLNVLIWDLAGVQPMAGACITSQIFSIGARMRAMEALIELRAGEEAAPVIKKLKAFTGKSTGLQELRNRIMHDPMVVGNQTGTPGQMRVAIVNNKLEFGGKPIPVEEIEQFSEAIKKHIDEFRGLNEEIRAVALSSPDKWSRQLMRINPH